MASSADAPSVSQRCWVSLGSNQERERSIRAAVSALAERFGRLRLSPVYESAAEGFVGAPFLNLVAGFDTSLSVGQLREELRAIEAANGRERDGPRFAPRTLDLDLLTFGDRIGEIDGYRLPRDEILTYAFVLGPLADVAPQERHPCDGRTYSALWKALSPTWPPLRRYALDFDDRAGNRR
jgi:2-amino-4-hydroxy-6-hydroxymethyldihydropteridine diphosphokinase